MVPGLHLTSETPLEPDAACVPVVWFLFGPVSLIYSDIRDLIGGWPFDDDDDVFGRAHGGMHHQKAACVSLMWNFFEKILWPLEHEFMK